MALPPWASTGLGGSWPWAASSPPKSGQRRRGPPSVEATETAEAIRQFESGLRSMGLQDDTQSDSSGSDPGPADELSPNRRRTQKPVHCEVSTKRAGWECRQGGDSSEDDELGLPSTLRQRDDAAATKIQASMRGVRTRKEIKATPVRAPPRRRKWPFSLSEELWPGVSEAQPTPLPREIRRRRAAGKWPRVLSELVYPRN
eukprot:TRINITY_DN19654_c0_g1_i1.p1 TRINITY_DN19654_c0_g1~~TRINITY_DN19654_c0_g1_i1.p1  ORF type:complete len:220 (+),score=49.65 TRINITY_DN19654_c0_g1_i1:59-661(+)